MAINNDMVVSINYELTDKSTNDVIDSNIGAEPLDFITGMGHIIPGLENKLIEMNCGDNAKIEVAPADGYGEFNPEAIENIPAEQFAGIELSEGMALYANSEDGQTLQVTVKAFNDDEVTIDYNHPLAGKELVFDVTITDVRECTPAEKESGQIEVEEMQGGCSCGSHGGSCQN